MAVRPDNSARGIMTIPEVAEWFKDAMPGERMTYYVGDLAHDREKGHKCRKEALNWLANEMMRLDGKVDLTRHKHGVNTYFYQATKRKVQRPPIDWEIFGERRYLAKVA